MKALAFCLNTVGCVCLFCSAVASSPVWVPLAAGAAVCFVVSWSVSL
jgi:hypothetical protein